MYEDIWTGAKGFYKLEPAVADGGEVIIYAPHITEISTSHPEINEIGYHCRDYFVKQWDRFKHIHWGTLAHSTHLRGAGTYDAEPARSGCGCRVTLATRIPEEVCRAANLGYLDPASIDVAGRGRGGHVRRAERRRGPLPAALSGRPPHDEPAPAGRSAPGCGTAPPIMATRLLDAGRTHRRAAAPRRWSAPARRSRRGACCRSRRR